METSSVPVPSYATCTGGAVSGLHDSKYTLGVVLLHQSVQDPGLRQSLGRMRMSTQWSQQILFRLSSSITKSAVVTTTGMSNFWATRFNPR
jgi:hypothetical protein